jgi:cob(I)alamin adenosyltransferase
MKLYTKQGDTGSTTLYTGTLKHISKSDPIFDVLGDLDELSASLGMAHAYLRSDADSAAPIIEEHGLSEWFTSIQSLLLDAGACIASPGLVTAAAATTSCRYEWPVADLEKSIDEVDSKNSTLTTFVLPGGDNLTSSSIHVARSVARRAERTYCAWWWHCLDEEQRRTVYDTVVMGHLLVFLNRLSDWLFAVARRLSTDEITYVPAGSKKRPN